MKTEIDIPIRRIHPNAKLPERRSQEAAGYDLFAAIEAPLRLLPMARLLVPTGFAMALPKGFEAQIRPRSGLALNYGLTLLNSPGTIDSDYRGEIKVILVNFGSEPYFIQPQERIAQMVIAEHSSAKFFEAELSETQRGEGGFGSTGK